MDFEDILKRANNIASVVETEENALVFLFDTRKDKIAIQEKHDQEVDLLSKVMVLFKNLSEQESEKSRALFISLVNFGLNAIFGPDVRCDLAKKDYATGTFYVPVLLKNGNVEDPFASGGGILDILAFLFRIVLIVSFFKEDSRVLRLDEPFKNLSVTYREKAVQLIMQLQEQFSIQFIFSTHISEYVDIESAKIIKTNINPTKKTTEYITIQEPKSEK